jgi:apolipoprotein N-acyltransferase
VRVRIAFWLLLCLAAGGPSAFLALEFVGIPYAAAVFFAVVWVGWRRKILPETLLAFGLTYAIEIFRIVSFDVFSWLQPRDYLTSAYFAAHIVVAIGIVGAGFTLLVRRRSAPTGPPAAQVTDPPLLP